MMKSEKIRQKSMKQLHKEIMKVFIGQNMGKTLVAMIETMVAMSAVMEISDLDLIELLVAELSASKEMENEND